MAYVPGAPPIIPQNPNTNRVVPIPAPVPTITNLPGSNGPETPPAGPARTAPGGWFQNWRATRPGPRMQGGPTPSSGPSLNTGPAPISDRANPRAPRIPIYSSPAGPTPIRPNPGGGTGSYGPPSGPIYGGARPGMDNSGMHDFSQYAYPDWFMQGVQQYGMNPEQAAAAWAQTGLPIPMAPQAPSPGGEPEPAPSSEGGRPAPRPGYEYRPRGGQRPIAAPAPQQPVATPPQGVQAPMPQPQVPHPYSPYYGAY